jgi:hypothetical protein
MKKCRLCNKDFEEKHFNQKYCSIECKWKVKRKIQERYKKSEKGKLSNERWIKSNKKNERENRKNNFERMAE